MLEKYILNEKGRPVLERDLFKWSKWFSENINKRIIARNEIDGKVISTTFLGVSHRFSKSPKPLLYETMVFGEEVEMVQRYCTRREAVEGHKKIYSELSK